MFDLAGFDGEIVADLFGEDSYFADAGHFWTAQNAAIAARADAYREAGWGAVVILDPGESLHWWIPRMLVGGLRANIGNLVAVRHSRHRHARGAGVDTPPATLRGFHENTDLLSWSAPRQITPSITVMGRYRPRR